MTRIETEMAQYPETGIVNPYIGTKLCLSQEMIDFFNGYLLEYKDYPDAKIAKEFAEKFEFTKDGAKKIEHAYVVVNRSRIYKRIKNLLKRGKTAEEVVEQIQIDFGLSEENAEKYVRRCMRDELDNVGGCLLGKKSAVLDDDYPELTPKMLRDIESVRASFAMEGMRLTDEDITRAKEILSGRKTIDEIIEELNLKYWSILDALDEMESNE